MKLTASRPATLISERYAERMTPFMFRSAAGSLLLYVQYGHDAQFSPVYRLTSTDNGQSWHQPTDNVPRLAWAHSFADGELYEVDTYGVLHPDEEDTFYFYGAWSYPDKPNDVARPELVRLHAPSARAFSVAWSQGVGGGYPTHHWWPLFNQVMGKEEVGGDDVFIPGVAFTTGIEMNDGRLIAVGFTSLKNATAIKYADDEGMQRLEDNEARESCKYGALILESRDRGKSWEEIAVLRDDDPTRSFNETTLLKLKDGRLYVVMRTDPTGKQLYHAWSSDEGHTWTTPEPLFLVDEPDHIPGMIWPVARALEDGTLVMVYGRPGKHIVFDPSGTGTQWQGRLNLHANELETQAYLGVPPEKRLRGDTSRCIRYWDSIDMLTLLEVAPREFFVAYDVQQYVENWLAPPVSAIRMVKVRLED